jgi:DNA-binding CsgD family transcriptional regulator
MPSILIHRVAPVKHTRLFNQFKESTSDRHSSSFSVEQLINKINNTVSYDDVPDRVVFGYNYLEHRGLGAKDIADIVNITNKITASKFGVPVKQIQLTGAARRPISNEFYNDLKNNGFHGGCLSAEAYGLEHALDAHSQWLKDPDRWHTEILPADAKIITSPKPIEIELTFRQQQVLHLIKNRGLTNGRIAKELGISEQAVKQHITLILKKYGVQSRTQLVLASGEGLRI